VFENRVLRRIFGPKWDDVAGDWKNLHNEKQNNWYPIKYYYGDKIREKGVGGAC
jgi:hypothetical protein